MKCQRPVLCNQMSSQWKSGQVEVVHSNSNLYLRMGDYTRRTSPSVLIIIRGQPFAIRCPSAFLTKCPVLSLKTSERVEPACEERNSHLSRGTNLKVLLLLLVIEATPNRERLSQITTCSMTSKTHLGKQHLTANVLSKITATYSPRQKSYGHLMYRTTYKNHGSDFLIQFSPNQNQAFLKCHFDVIFACIY